MKNKFRLSLIVILSIFILIAFTSCGDFLDWLLDDGGENEDPYIPPNEDPNKNPPNEYPNDDPNNDPNDNPPVNSDVILSSNFNDGTFNGWTISGYGSASVTTAAEEAPGDSYFGNDTRFVKLPAPRVSGGRSIVLSRNINFENASAITFSFKTEIHQPFGQNFKLYVNDVERGSWNGLNTIWRTETILLTAGVKNIRFEVSSTGTYVVGGLNAVYIDNISIAPDVTHSVILYPRGKLNTYVGAPDNEKIMFSAKSFRADGSVRENESNYVFSGTGVNSGSGILTPSAAGNVTVSVSVNGRTASTNVTVHPADYLRRPYTYMGTGITYNGFQGTEGTRTAGSVTVTYPSELTFDADGFFTLEGSVNNSAVFNYSLVRVTKNNDTALQTDYLVRDKFKQRIWLRFGPGVYTVSVWNLTKISLSSGLGAEGDYSGASYSGAITFTVNNIRNDGSSKDAGTPDKRYIYPSYLAQSDDFRITNLVSDLTYGLSTERDKIKAINDYLVMNTVYDRESYLVEGMRKKQDALTVLGKKYKFDSKYPNGHFLAVCEGYTNAGNALMRAAGIEARYISSVGMGHAWNEVFTEGGWKFLDITWNDPSVEGANETNIVDKGPSFVSYEYFLLTSAPFSHRENGTGVPNGGRSIINIESAPWIRGAPEGWY